MDVAVVSAEPLFLDGLVAILEAHAQFNVVSSGTNIRETIRRAALTDGGVALVDMKDVSDNDVDYLVGAQEFGGFRTVLIGHSVRAGQEFGLQLSREVRSSELVRAIAVEEMALGGRRNLVASREPGTNRGTAAGAPAEVKRGRGRPREFTNSLPLSSREYQAATHIAAGLTNRQIAEVMGLKEQSAKNLVAIIARKLGCEGREGITKQLKVLRT